jgi:regulator of protease activity HflC (stomatin/prohibitin superfamily)
MGFEKLIDLLVQFAALFKPFTVVSPAKRAIVCRLGKIHRELDNGFHFIWPFAIEQVYDMSLSTRIAELQAQALVTKDGKSVVAGIVITYRVHDVEKAIFSVWDAFAAATDACETNFASAVLTSDYDELRTEEFAAKLTTECRKQGFKYGFEIERVRLWELAPARTIRLIGGGGLAQSQG